MIGTTEFSTALIKANNTAPVQFAWWLACNRPIWDEFCVLANKMKERGRDHWSARAIIDVLRWDRALRDPTDPLFKINNNRTPQLGRLYNELTNSTFFVVHASGTGRKSV